LLNLYAAFGIDLNGSQRIFVKDALQALYRLDFVRTCYSVVDFLMIGSQQRLAEIAESRLDAAHLLRERLQRQSSVGRQRLLSEQRCQQCCRGEEDSR
jgi:hypothetical protein